MASLIHVSSKGGLSSVYVQGGKVCSVRSGENPLSRRKDCPGIINVFSSLELMPVPAKVSFPVPFILVMRDVELHVNASACTIMENLFILCYNALQWRSTWIRRAEAK